MTTTREGDRLHLGRAIIPIVRRLEMAPCFDDPRFTSEDPYDREQVLEVCHDCHALEACRTAGRHESIGVWGGIDYTQKAPVPTRSTK